MRIVHAVHSTTFAGVERYVATTSGALAERGHDLLVVTNEPLPMREALGGSSVQVFGASGVFGLGRALVSRARGSDIVHAHMTAAEVAAVWTRTFVRAPIVTTRHFPARRGSSLLGRAAAPFVSRRVATEIAISRYVADNVPEVTEVLLNGVPDAPPVDLSSPVVLVVQRLEREKCTGDALGAWIASGLAAEGWELWIVGDGIERRSLEKTASQGAHSGVRFLGQRRDIAGLHRAAAMMLAPAPGEPFGLSVVEAMAAGLPVVASGSGGHLETVGAVRPDLLFAARDVQACAELLRRLAHGGAAVRLSVGEELRRFQQQRLGMQSHADKLEALYQRVIAARGPSHRRANPRRVRR